MRVQVWRFEFGMAIDAEVAPAQVVRENDNDVGSLIGRSGLSKQRRDQEPTEKSRARELFSEWSGSTIRVEPLELSLRHVLWLVIALELAALGRPPLERTTRQWITRFSIKLIGRACLGQAIGGNPLPFGESPAQLV